MSYVGIARKVGTITANLEKLIRRGEGSPGISGAIRTTSTNSTAADLPFRSPGTSSR